MRKAEMKFIAIVGTNAQFSYNRKLLWYMKKHFQEQAEIEILEIADLPYFSEDAFEIPQAILEISQKIQAADGVIFSTPEYNHAITSALKSLLEWLSSQPLRTLQHLPVMIVGAALGNLGTVFAQENLRQILNSPGLEAAVLPGNQFLLGQAAHAFDRTGELMDASTIDWLAHCFDNFMRFAQSHSLPQTDLPATSGLNWAGPYSASLTDADTGASEY